MPRFSARRGTGRGHSPMLHKVGIFLLGGVLVFAGQVIRTFAFSGAVRRGGDALSIVGVGVAVYGLAS